MIACELVTVAALTLHRQPVTKARRVCLQQIIRRARREGAIVVDLRNGKVWLPADFADVLEVGR